MHTEYDNVFLLHSLLKLSLVHHRHIGINLPFILFFSSTLRVLTVLGFVSNVS